MDKEVEILMLGSESSNLSSINKVVKRAREIHKEKHDEDSSEFVSLLEAIREEQIKVRDRYDKLKEDG